MSFELHVMSWFRINNETTAEAQAKATHKSKSNNNNSSKTAKMTIVYRLHAYLAAAAALVN